ncbi:MAG: hypothetical protein AB7F19_04640 [Candidatus Babeliales bacterium]
MLKEIVEQILKGNFEQANELILNYNEDNLYNLVFSIAYDSSTIAAYSFVVNLLIKKQSSENHGLVAELLALPLCFYHGAYSVALYHARKAIILDSTNNIENTTFLILFHDIPEQLVSPQEAYQVATKILHVDPTVTVAQRVIKKYENGRFDTDISFLPVFKISALLTDRLTKEMYVLLNYAKFEEVRELVKDISLDQLFTMMTIISQQEQTLTLYGYVVNLLLHQEIGVTHQLASRVLVELLNTIEGVYVSAYWHAKRAVELAPQEIEYKLWLLKFKTLPGDLLSNDEAVKLAHNIIDIDPDNVEALTIRG